MTEDELIAEVFRPLATGPGADDLGDDAATIAPDRRELVVTCDALAAGVHFVADDPPEAIAAKALRVNLSDLAAKGAEPFGYVLALALAPGWTVDWARRFADGLAADQSRYGIALLGGDTLRASPGGGTMITITAFGHAERIVRRRTASPGDIIIVTGTIGDAALGLKCHLGEAMPALSTSSKAALIKAYLRPTPPVACWRAVAAHASASMDISDGLLTDLAKLTRTADVSAAIDLAKVPFSPAVQDAIGLAPPLRDLALTGGDDYQILATVPPTKADAYIASCAALGTNAVAIGKVSAGPPAVRTFERGVETTITSGRFNHFG
ncbi:MAG: thiamine-phosphate kinase [Pseudomonadota bacterium]